MQDLEEVYFDVDCRTFILMMDGKDFETAQAEAVQEYKEEREYENKCRT